jgi:hypothetical protein
MFLNIFFAHHNSTAAAEHGSDFRIHANKVKHDETEVKTCRNRFVTT